MSFKSITDSRQYQKRSEKRSLLDAPLLKRYYCGNKHSFSGTTLNRISIIIALFAVVIGTVACPFMSHHPGELNPLHSFLVLVPGQDTPVHNLRVANRHMDGGPSNDDQSGSSSGESPGTLSLHNHDLSSSAGVVIISGGAAMAHFDPQYFSLSNFLLNSDTHPMQPQDYVSLPDKPPCPRI